MYSLPEVFSLDEIARASGVPRSAVRKLLEEGGLSPLAGTEWFAAGDALRAGRRARQESADSLSPRPLPLSLRLPTPLHDRRASSTLVSTLVHLAILAAVISSATRAAETAPATTRRPTRLVFVAGLGPGGGGGGGDTPRASRLPTPKPLRAPAESTPQLEPIPSRSLIPPVAATVRERRLEAPVSDGAGDGTGSGFGQGSGGGTGGGPFRPGPGIEPPGLLQEIKAQYTEDARRRGINGRVILDVVVQRDGRVGDVNVLRGLDSGLDARAVSAVKAWRFTPARRLGEPVDVIVEVDVEFSLR